MEDPLLEGYLRGARANELVIGLPDGAYRITLAAHDPAKAHGPFSVTADGTPLFEQVRTSPNAPWRGSADLRVRGGVLRLGFVPGPGADFIVNALEIQGPESAELRPVCASAPSVSVPSRAELPAAGEAEARQALRAVCDWLLEHRRGDGYLGDTDDNWYTASMPVRALLAGFDILGDTRYRDAALRVMDLFVGEQMPSGAFCGVYRGKPTAALSPAEVEHLAVHARQPMSDIGSVVCAVAVASRYADRARSAGYVDSLRKFCDGWAIRFQEPSGAFTDGPWGKDWLTTTYSCATAIEAAVFALAAAVTGDKAYARVAVKAIDYLLHDWREDGRMLGRAPHWEVHGRRPFVMETLYFGDLWYYDDGFITTARHCGDAAARARIEAGIGWRVFGEAGLLAALGGKAWWPIQDIWNNAKSVGMVQTLLYARAIGRREAELEGALASMRSFLCNPEYARRVGVMADDRERPVAKFGYQTWTGMDRQSAGFAGMTLAEMLKPGVLYLDA